MVTEAAEPGGASYTFRERVGETVRVTATADEIDCRNTAKGDVRLPWSEVREIRLVSPVEGAFVCRILPRKGKPVLLANRSMMSATEIRTQNGLYLDFVWKLHHFAAPQRHIRFVAGNATWYVFALVAVVVMTALLLLFVGLLAWSAVEGKLDRVALPASPLATAAFVIPVLLHWMKKNRPHAYDPTQVPEHLLPFRRET